jgi:RNAse (barnase) inhibitor barstar
MRNEAPIYVMVDEPSADVLVKAEDVSGFFVRPGEEPDEVTFLGVHMVNNSRKATEDAVLNILNRQGEKIGEYFIGRTSRRRMSTELVDSTPPHVSYRPFVNRCEFPEAESIWRRWALGPKLKKNEWPTLPASHQNAWLHVVQNSWFSSGHRAARYGTNGVAGVDGAMITSKPGFYCALGEAVNGPAGYFGSNLDALADCLSSEAEDPEAPPLKILWTNFRASQSSLGREFTDSVVSTLLEFNVKVTKY